MSDNRSTSVTLVGGSVSDNISTSVALVGGSVPDNISTSVTLLRDNLRVLRDGFWKLVYIK